MNKQKQSEAKPARSGRRSDHSKDEIRELVVAAATRIVNEEGLSGLSARKIANEIGYNVAMLYHFFDNLDHIILKVNAQTLKQLFLALQSASDKCRQPRTCIIALGRTYIDFALENRHLWNMIFEHSLPEDAVIPAWYQSSVDRMFALVQDLMTPMYPNFTPKKIDQSSHALWCGVHGICVLAVTRKLEMEDKEIHALAESLISHYLSGLGNNNK